MKKLILLFWLVILVTQIEAKDLISTDSLVIYYREFCADYGIWNSNYDKIKTFGAPYKYTITDTKKIRQIYSQLKKVKRKESDSYQKTDGIVLGCYSYEGGREKLLFVIFSFGQIEYENEVYLYKDKLLDILFDTHKDCYY